MKCPYQKKVTYRPPHIDNDGFFMLEYAEDITEFGECLRSECPFYQRIEYKQAKRIIETCRRAESECS